jgi:predicted nucleic acid-binding protein
VIVALDASVLVAHLDERDAHHAAATQLLLDIAESELVASPITLAEVSVGPARTERLSEAQALIDALAVREVPLGTDAALRLALLRARTGLKLPDCCVLLAAADATAESIATFDNRLATVARRVGLQVR